MWGRSLAGGEPSRQSGLARVEVAEDMKGKSDVGGGGHWYRGVMWCNWEPGGHMVAVDGGSD